MIGFFRLLPPPEDSAGVLPLRTLPAPPGAGLSGLMMGCDIEGEVERGLDWYNAVRTVRPLFAFGLVAPPEACAAALGSCTHPVRPVLSPADLQDGALPLEALAEVRARSVEGRILNELVSQADLTVLSERRILECLIAHAVRGGTVARVARDLGLSQDTVERRLRRHKWLPGEAMSQIRLSAYELRVELGATPRAALSACGWSSQNARRKAQQRCARKPMRKFGEGHADIRHWRRKPTLAKRRICLLGRNPAVVSTISVPKTLRRLYQKKRR